jgi:hypothetical protein
MSLPATHGDNELSTSSAARSLQWSQIRGNLMQEVAMDFETLKARKDGAILFRPETGKWISATWWAS